MTDRADEILMADARFLLSALENGLPSGETPDEVAMILELRIRQLEEMRPCQGRGGLIIDLGNRLHEFQKQAEQAAEKAEPNESAPVPEPDGKQVVLL